MCFFSERHALQAYRPIEAVASLGIALQATAPLRIRFAYMRFLPYNTHRPIYNNK